MAKKDLILLLLCFVFTVISSCKKHYDTNDSDLTSDTPGSEEVSDYTWNSADIISITLNGSSVFTNSTALSVSGSKVTITSAVTYDISGSSYL